MGLFSSRFQFSGPDPVDAIGHKMSQHCSKRGTVHRFIAHDYLRTPSDANQHGECICEEPDVPRITGCFMMFLKVEESNVAK